MYLNTGITQPAVSGGNVTRATSYDANGNVATRTDWNGNRTTYSYDLARNLETSRTEGLTSGGATTPATRIIETQWHATFRLPTQVTEKDSGGTVLRTTGMTYDTNGTLLTRTVTAGASSRAWTYTYNANGSLLTMNGPRTDVSDVTTYAYYDNAATCPGTATMGCRGQVQTITNAAGHVTEITAYTAHGQPLTIVDPNTLVTTLTYDARQRLTSRSVGGETTTYEYDGVGQLTKVILPDTSFLQYTYDAAHRLTQIADNLGNRIAYTLDAMGNRTQEQVFDPANALAQTRSRVFNNLNRLAQDIGAQSQVTAYGYDNQGNVTSIDGPLAGTADVTANAYDALNRLIRVTDPNSGQVNYGYSALDQLASVSDPRSLATSYNYDGLNNLNQLVSPDTGTTGNTFDAAGNLLTSTDAKGQVTTYAYDALNRVTQITFHDTSRQTYSYDQGANGVGRLTGITETDPGSLVTSQLAYAYDQKGRITAETRTINGIAYVIGYSYDASGRLTGMIYPSGRNIAYTLDNLGRVAQINTTKDNVTQAVLLGVTYRPFGPVQSFTFGNSQTYTRGFDQDARIASYTLGAQSFAVGYDAASRIGFISDIGNPTNSNTYAYDNLDRLTNAVLPGTPFAYSYDAVSNRLAKTVGASTDTYTPAATSNRLASITPGAGSVRNLLYDANGATTNDGINQYAYDTRGRLVRAVTVLGTVQYQVNALGQRIAKILPGSGGGSSQTLFSDAFSGPDGRPIDDQSDGLWKGGGKQIAARVIGGQAEIALGRQLRTAADFALPGAGLMLQAKLARGKVALLNVAQDEGLIVRYAGNTIAVARARDDDRDDLADDANVRARFELSSPGAVLQLVMELRPGSARVRIAAGAQSFDTGEIALGAVQAGERYRVRLAAVKLRGQALSGLVDDVLLTVPGGGAPVAVTTHFVYDAQGRLIGEYTGQGAMMREYAYLQDLPLALIEPSGAVFFIHTDHLNTPRVITNQAGQAVWRWDHAEPFGSNPSNENPSGLGTFTSNLRLPGQYFDKETNLHYNYFRDYDPSIGRYIQSDPIGLEGGINTYAYAYDNPLSYFDPDGLEVRFLCRPVKGTRVLGRFTEQSHCFVYVICPQERWSLTLSLFAQVTSTGLVGQKARRDDPTSLTNEDNPHSNRVNYRKTITPTSPNCDCAFEKNVLNRFTQAPDDLVYGLFFSNSNTFAQYLVTSPSFGMALPPNVPANAPGFMSR
jgi:RHS repeat-associated protein